jgi:hypothetical protein
MDIREIEKGIELFYAFLRKNPTLCPHDYREFSRNTKHLKNSKGKYRLIRILRSCEHCNSTKVEYILLDHETGERLNTDSLPLSVLADFFNGLNGTFDKEFVSHFDAARAQVDILIVQYEETKREKEAEEKELYKKAFDKIGPFITQFN